MYHTIRHTVEKIARRLEVIQPLVYRRKLALPPFRVRYLAGPQTPPPVGKEVDDSAWPTIDVNSYWGHWYTDFVLRTRFRVPVEWDPESPVALYLPLGDAGDFSHPEALVYIDGNPLAAVDRHHQELVLPARWREGQEHLLALHGWTGLGGLMEGEFDTQLFMHRTYIVQIDLPTRDFLAMARVTLGIVRTLDEDAAERPFLLNALDKAFRQLDLREPFGDAFYASVPKAHAMLKAGITRAGAPMNVDIVATGHAHIDVAWLWPLAQARHKARRTFRTVIHLMEQFPDYHFTQSQPQLYEFVREDDPDLFSAIQQRVREGRWEPIGGMWVEADCNISGAESLARQFLLGRTYFQEHFGPDAESPVLWLPDVFGYSWALPQLIRQAGLKYFFTIKIGWNQYNRLPYDSFWWQGIDGTRVLTHFSPTPDMREAYASTYNAMATPQQVVGTWRNYQQKALYPEMLMAYGHGDGGGGPTAEMLENTRAMERFPATPRVRQGSVVEFFTRMEREAGDRLPTWNGELYLEMHRGTYTTQGAIKRANRKAEFLLHDAEFLAVLASLLAPEEYEYPHDTLHDAWRRLALNQFHDILPGSSVHPVYDDAQKDYLAIQSLVGHERDVAFATLAQTLPADILIVNPTSFPRNDVAFWPHPLPQDARLERADGTLVMTQASDGGAWLDIGALAPYSVAPLFFRPGGSDSAWETGLVVNEHLLENDLLKIEFDEAGNMVRLFDKEAHREILAPDTVGNQFQAFEDRPLNWDAWDIDIFYDDKMWLAEPATSVRVAERGPLRATLEIRRRILHSEITQRISLAYNSRRLDFHTRISWRERHVLLKVAFPVNILSPRATYEIQWGHVERPTHRNTSWDWARFESVAHKWVDLSEGNYGVSLINDCKYGHDIYGNVIRLSLLRGPTLPDPIADLGEHEFTYSLFPHLGALGAETLAAAYALNDPLLVWEGQPKGTVRPANLELVRVDKPNVVIETVKAAEDGRGIILRLYDALRMRGPVTLRFAFPVQVAWRTDLLEQDQVPVDVDSAGRLHLDLRPFEIVTLRVLPGRSILPSASGA